MAHWVKLRGNGGYVNLDVALSLQPTFVSSGDYGINVNGGSLLLEGSHSSITDAQDAARKITQGVDPSTLI